MLTAAKARTSWFGLHWWSDGLLFFGIAGQEAYDRRVPYQICSEELLLRGFQKVFPKSDTTAETLIADDACEESESIWVCCLIFRCFGGLYTFRIATIGQLADAAEKEGL